MALSGQGLLDMLCVVPRDDDSRFASIPLKELINHRVSQLVKQYQPDKDISDGHTVDTSVFYTVEDRPVVKERVSQYVDKQYIAKEFEKRVRLVSARDLPKSSEILNSRLVNVTQDVIAAEPWLGERSSQQTPLVHGPQTEPVSSPEESVPHTGEHTSSLPVDAAHQEPPTASNPSTLSTAPPADTAARQQPAIQGPSTAEQGPTASSDVPSSPRVHDGEDDFLVVSHPPTPPKPESSTTSLPASQPPDSAEGSSKKSSNPFKKFVKLKSRSSKLGDASATPTTPVSPNNPFGKFVKRDSKPAENASDRAIVPAGAQQSQEAEQSRSKKKSLKWFFVAPFSGPKPAKERPSDVGTSASGPTSPDITSEDVAAKPTMEPFLDQSLSNSDLGRRERERAQAMADPSSTEGSQPAVEPARSSPSPVAGSSQTQAAIPHNSNGQSMAASKDLPGSLTPQHGKSAPVGPAAGSPPSLGVESPASRASQPRSDVEPPQQLAEGMLSASAIKENSYNAALARCTEFVEADMQKAQHLVPEGSFVEYFVQIEEIWTRREVIETFVEHNHYLLQHVMQTVYKGERRLPTFTERLSEQRLLVEPVQT